MEFGEVSFPQRFGSFRGLGILIFRGHHRYHAGRTPRRTHKRCGFNYLPIP